jgi:predicted DsbA family dithiol-disulfide isomerase
MSHPIVRIYFDFVDPLSYITSHVLGLRSGSVDETPHATVEWVGFELRPPPAPLTEAVDAIWADRWREARLRVGALQLTLDPPRLIPWTRKAHELHILAGLQGQGENVRVALFEAFFRRGRDIGRVDVLIEIGAAAGLDRTETKAVLDVDRHQADVISAREEAQAFGVTDVPVLSVDGRPVEGFPDPTDLGTLLPGP